MRFEGTALDEHIFTAYALDEDGGAIDLAADVPLHAACRVNLNCAVSRAHARPLDQFVFSVQISAE